jgi:membrane-associated phospholipid phosphatase
MTRGDGAAPAGRSDRTEHPLLGTPRRDVVVTVLLALATAALFLLVAMPSTRAHVQQLDDAFLRRMVAIRSAPLTAPAKVLNLLGFTIVMLPARLLIAGYLALRRRWWHFAAFVSAIVLSEICIGTLKALYDRPRPPGSLVRTSGASFPSGHAVAASVTVVAAVIALFPEGPKRYLWGALAAAFAMLMGLSRAYLAAHWLSDAVAGVLLGTSCAMVAALAVHVIRERREPEAERMERTPRPPRVSSPDLAPGAPPP